MKRPLLLGAALTLASPSQATEVETGHCDPFPKSSAFYVGEKVEIGNFEVSPLTVVSGHDALSDLGYDPDTMKIVHNVLDSADALVAMLTHSDGDRHATVGVLTLERQEDAKRLKRDYNIRMNGSDVTPCSEELTAILREAEVVD